MRVGGVSRNVQRDGVQLCVERVFDRLVLNGYVHVFQRFHEPEEKLVVDRFQVSVQRLRHVFYASCSTGPGE